uniref:Double zinc ribbon and ankyrin repeat domains 1 n=1 Tax=Denticeps clupeoides TaxID=299321 RepID=A0AAY4A6P4_9TELE
MTAGSVSAPHIIPVRAPVAARAQARIDTATPVEITSDSPGAKIHFTLDGSRPEATRRPGTLLFTAAIHLPAGRVTVKALAASSDGRESAVVTKVFQVEEAGGGDEDAMIPVSGHRIRTRVDIYPAGGRCLQKPDQHADVPDPARDGLPQVRGPPRPAPRPLSGSGRRPAPCPLSVPLQVPLLSQPAGVRPAGPLLFALRRRGPPTARPETSPYRRWTGRRPPHVHLHVLEKRTFRTRNGHVKFRKSH